MTSVLITGATGFLGTKTVIKLIQKKENRVYALHRQGSSISFLESKQAENLIFVNIDEEGALQDCFETGGIDVVLHTATSYGRSNLEIESVIESNLKLPLIVLNYALVHNVAHFVNIDSYFNKEGFEYKHLFDYSQSKRALIPWLKHYSNEIDVSNLVIEHMYGPGDGENKFVPSLIRSALSNFHDGFLLSPGEQRRDFVFIDDVVNAIETVIYSVDQVGQGYKSYEVGTGRSLSLIEFATEVVKQLGISAVPNFGKTPYRTDEIMDSFANIRGLSELGWSPNVPLHEGLNRTIRHYRVVE